MPTHYLVTKDKSIAMSEYNRRNTMPMPTYAPGDRKRPDLEAEAFPRAACVYEGALPGYGGIPGYLVFWTDEPLSEVSSFKPDITTTTTPMDRMDSPKMIACNV